jgi:hypothetical protein
MDRMPATPVVHRDGPSQALLVDRALSEPAERAWTFVLPVSFAHVALHQVAEQAESFL